MTNSSYRQIVDFVGYLISYRFSLDGLMKKLKLWKAGMEEKGLRVNMEKTKVMVSGANLQTLKDS